jgi:hypothetical protein
MLTTISEDLSYPRQLATPETLILKGFQIYSAIMEHLNDHLILVTLKTAFKNGC